MNDYLPNYPDPPKTALFKKYQHECGLLRRDYMRECLAIDDRNIPLWRANMLKEHARKLMELLLSNITETYEADKTILDQQFEMECAAMRGRHSPKKETLRNE